MTKIGGLWALFAAFNRVATYRKRGKIGVLGCVDVGEKLQQKRTDHKQTPKHTTKHTINRLKSHYIAVNHDNKIPLFPAIQ